MPEVHVELLLGKRVMDPSGKSAGRIEELRARRDGEDMLVREYLLGPYGLAARLLDTIRRLPFMGDRRAQRGIRVPWDKMDLSDPTCPRILCSVEQLKASPKGKA